MTQNRHPIASSIRAHSRVQAQALEFRLLLATYVVTNTNDAGTGSLRQAIVNANANAGADTINFNIPGTGTVRTITPKTELPAVTGPTTIDATTQPGYVGRPIVQLEGSTAATANGALHLSGGASTVRGLILSHWGGLGIWLREGDG